MKQKHLLLIMVTALLFSCRNEGQNISELDLFPIYGGGDIQYVNREGEIIINPQFSGASVFRDGLALVKTSDSKPRWGYIDKKGKFVINPIYKSATIFSDGLAWVITDDREPRAINRKGEFKISLSEAKNVRIFKEGLAAYSIKGKKRNKKWGFINKKGEVIINPQFTKTSDFKNGMCAVRNDNGKWGYINSDGEIIINYQFDKAESFINSYAIVELDNKMGVIDKNGKYIINPQFSKMIHDGNLFLVEQNDAWGWCDDEGSIIINPQFDRAFPFNGSKLAAVESGGNWGFINNEGKLEINPQFEGVLPFNGNLAIVVNNGNEDIGFIDKEGKYIVNPQFTNIPRDLILYIMYGISNFESVISDYY